MSHSLLIGRVHVAFHPDIESDGHARVAQCESASLGVAYFSEFVVVRGGGELHVEEREFSLGELTTPVFNECREDSRVV